VTRKLLEALFSNLVILALPPIVIVSVVTFLLLRQDQYQADASIWMERAQYLAQDDLDRYTTPAQRQRDRLTELLHTRSFRADIAARTPLAPLAKSERGQDQLQAMFSTDLEILAVGNNLVTLSFRSADPELCFAVVTAVVEVFRARDNRDRSEQAKVAIAFYDSSLQEAQGEFSASSASLKSYLDANPNLRTTGPQVSIAATDLRLADLVRLVETDANDVSRAESRLRQARREVAASTAGYEIGFQVLDDPQLPLTPVRPVRKLVLYGTAAFAGGLSLSAALLVALMFMDGTVRGAGDLPSTARVVGAIPPLRPTGSAARKKDAVRRGVVFATTRVRQST